MTKVCRMTKINFFIKFIALAFYVHSVILSKNHLQNENRKPKFIFFIIFIALAFYVHSVILSKNHIANIRTE